MQTQIILPRYAFGQRWLTLREFTALYHVGRRRIMGAIARGELRAIRSTRGIWILDPGRQAATMWLFYSVERLRELPLLTTAEVGRLCNLSHREVRERAAARRLRSSIVGRELRYSLIDVEDFIKRKGADSGVVSLLEPLRP